MTKVVGVRQLESNMKCLDNVTLFGVDCVNIDRLIKAIAICETHMKFKDIKLLTSLPTNYKYAVKIPPITNIREYSKFMICNLVDYIDTEYVLTIQWDGYILNPDAWTDEFLEVDYCGANWWFNDHRNVGNGAFSLRSKKFLVEVSKMPTKNYHPEDLVCCRIMSNYLKNRGIKFASEKLAHRFSHEGNNKYGTIWKNQLGWHDSEVTNLCNCKNELTDITKLDQLKYWGNKFE